MNYKISQFTSGIHISKKAGYILLGVALVIFSLLYDFDRIINLRPQSIHHWRQTDCTSLVLNYYNHGLKFFKPEIHNHQSDNWNSGYAVGECPVFYYMIALLYKVTGPHEYIHRLLTILIFFFGLYGLFELCYSYFKDTLLSVLVPLLLFTAPIIVFYSLNFVIDPVPLSLCFWGYYYGLRNRELKPISDHYKASIFFVFAGLLKITAMMNVIAMIFGLLLITLTRNSFRSNIKAFTKVVWPYVLTLLIAFSWVAFAKWYNHVHDSVYFSTRTWPYWQQTPQMIEEIKTSVSRHWIYDFYAPFTTKLLIGFFIFSLVMCYRISRELIGIFFMLIAGVIAFIILWFFAFRDHDYYYILLYVLPVFTVITTILIAKELLPKLLLVIQIGMLILVIYNVRYASNKIYERYTEEYNDYFLYEGYYSIKPYLKELGIKKTDKVICIGDATPNTALYLIDQPGYSQFGIDSESSLRRAIEHGAKFLLSSETAILNEPWLAARLEKQIGEHKNVKVFSLKTSY
jgi:hypothetical protein